jgi:hypothetical protein
LQFTDVVPSGNDDPDEGEHEGVSGVPPSEAETEYVATVEDAPFTLTVRGEGSASVGGVVS